MSSTETAICFMDRRKNGIYVIENILYVYIYICIEFYFIIYVCCVRAIFRIMQMVKDTCVV